MRRWEEEEYYRRVMEEERFWEEEQRRRYEAEFFEGWGPSRMGPARGPPGLLGPRPLMDGSSEMVPVSSYSGKKVISRDVSFGSLTLSPLQLKHDKFPNLKGVSTKDQYIKGQGVLVVDFL